MPLPEETDLSVNFFIAEYNLDDVKNEFYSNSMKSSEYRDLVLNYISGYIQMRICAKEICIFCRDFLSNMKIVENGGLISSKNRGGLSFPSIEFPKVVRLTNSVFEVILKKEPNPLKIKNLIE